MYQGDSLSEQTEPDGNLNLVIPNKGSSDLISASDGGSADPLSPVVKESGIVDLSRDPTKYYGLKGVILGLKGMIIPTGKFYFQYLVPKKIFTCFKIPTILHKLE